MDIGAYREEIKLLLTGDLLEIELSDSTIDKIINSALREIQRYLCSTKMITIPFENCIDMTEYKVSSVSRIYRASGYTSDSEETSGYAAVDPMQASQWQLLSGIGNLDNFSEYALNYASWNTLLQIRNTATTDLAFKYDKAGEKLYINVSTNKPDKITVEYVPRIDNVEDVVSDFWIDMLTRVAVAKTKIAVGRIRSRYTQANALWTQDGQQILEEGNSELNELRQYMQANTQLVYPYD